MLRVHCPYDSQMERSSPAAARLPSWLDAALSHPVVYRLQTKLLGRARLEAMLKPTVDRLGAGREKGVVVDVGGGISPYRGLWPKSWTYYCVDPDRRVAADAEDHGAVIYVEGIASRVPLDDGCADIVLMSAVSHHLDDATWSASLAEAARLATEGGAFLFVDGVWNPRRFVSRLGWLADGGGHPRSADVLEADIAATFAVESVDRMTLLHDVVIVVGRLAD